MVQTKLVWRSVADAAEALLGCYAWMCGRNLASVFQVGDPLLAVQFVKAALGQMRIRAFPFRFRSADLSDEKFTDQDFVHRLLLLVCLTTFLSLDRLLCLTTAKGPPTPTGLASQSWLG